MPSGPFLLHGSYGPAHFFQQSFHRIDAKVDTIDNVNKEGALLRAPSVIDQQPIQLLKTQAYG
jgi:hypothetical protein